MIFWTWLFLAGQSQHPQMKSNLIPRSSLLTVYYATPFWFDYRFLRPFSFNRLTNHMLALLTSWHVYWSITEINAAHFDSEFLAMCSLGTLRRLKRVFHCCSVCERMEDNKVGYLMVWSTYMSPRNSIVGLYVILVTMEMCKVHKNVLQISVFVIYLKN